MASIEGERAQAQQMGEVIAELREMRKAVESLEADMADMREKYIWGKGALFIITLVIGFAIFGAKEAIKRVLGF